MHSVIIRIAPLATGLLLLAMISAPAMAGSDMTFQGSDGQTVHATLSPATAQADSDKKAVVLLFHQAGANRHEYDPVVPRLTPMGFDTLAVDQRSGGDKFGHSNQTVHERGGSSDYQAAYPDLEGAVAWAQRHHYQTIIAVGSSYSSALVLQLAAAPDNGLTAAAAFSPGEYFDPPDLIKNAVAHARVPLYITTDPAEENNVDEILSHGDGSRITRYQPEHGVHGASTLVADRDPAGYRANWNNFKKFMARFVPTGS